jgi:DedD protein
VEKATKERLTGAVIFFAVLAVAVPELLSGPGDGIAQQDGQAVAEAGPPLTTYDLAIDPAAAREVAQQQALGADSAARSEAIAQAVPPPVIGQVQELPPAPSSSTTAGPAALPDAATVTAEPRAAEEGRAGRVPEVAERPATASTGAAGRWWVQLGSFSSESNAQRLARDLRGAGFTIDVTKVTAGGRDLHRVRAGPASDRVTATALRDRLVAAGQQGTLVPP